jgi:hypothetical protein
MVNRPDNMPRIAAPAYTEPVVRVRNNPSTPSPEVQPPATPSPAPVEAPSSTDKVRKLGVSESSPVKISFQTPAAASPNAIQGVRRLNASEDIMELPDLPSFDVLPEAVDYYHSALSAVQEGALDMAQDFLAWARELDPGAPDLPSPTAPQP